ncbi:MAG TPA: MarR family transcriptional regulator [Syntrophorhabdaceae bacterium]|nr:MarR family transcriptional regulator [Syntrophorhabdaceae bacterium]
MNRELSEQELEITVEQWPILIHLWDKNGQSQKDLARKLFKDKTTIARLTAPLEALGMIEREPNQEDAREKSIFLTRKGNEIMARATVMVQKIDRRAEEGIDEKDLAICKSVLRSVHKNLAL